MLLVTKKYFGASSGQPSKKSLSDRVIEVRDEKPTILQPPDIPATTLNRPRVDDINWGITFNEEPNYPSIPCNLPIQSSTTVVEFTLTYLAGIDFNVTWIASTPITEIIYRYETTTTRIVTSWFFDPCNGVSGSSLSNSEFKMEHSVAVGGNPIPADPYVEIPIEEEEEVEDEPLQRELMQFTGELIFTVMNSANSIAKVEGFTGGNPELHVSDFSVASGSQHRQWYLPPTDVEAKIVIPVGYKGVFRKNYRLFLFTNAILINGIISNDFLSYRKEPGDEVLDPDTYTFVRRAK